MKYTDSKIIFNLYQYARDFSEFCEFNNIKYWISYGTLLGAVRHKGIIPWDDDVDFQIDESDVEMLLSEFHQLNKLGYEIKKWYFGGFRIYKYHIGDELMEFDTKNSSDQTCRFPFIDIFVMKNDDGNIVHTSESFTELNGKLRAWQIEHLVNYQFGNFTLKGPMQPNVYLTDQYGSGWEQIAEEGYDHYTQTNSEKVMKLPTRNPAEPSDQSVSNFGN